MKTSLVSFLVITAICSGVLKAQFVEPVRTLTVQSTNQPIVIDGQANEDSWSENQDLSVFIDDGWTGNDDLSGYIKLTWDLSNLYLFAAITDDTDHSANDEADSPWMFDCIDVVFDLDTNNASPDYDENSVELRLNRGTRGFTFPGRADPEDFEYIILNDPDTGWVVEAAIPWTAALPGGSEPEDIYEYVSNDIGFDVLFDDSDGTDPSYGERDAQMAWDRDYHPDFNDYESFQWNYTHVFGIITLMGDLVELPEADAGPDQVVDENTTVYLDGTNSTDPGGSDLNYTWIAPSQIALSDEHSATPSFLAPDVQQDTDFKIELIVRNDSIKSRSDFVTVSVNKINSVPVAHAGNDTIVYETNIIFFNGNKSYDADDDVLTFIWRSEDGLQFNNFTSPSPVVLAPEVNQATEYRFNLTVSDGEASSVPDTVIVTVANLTGIDDHIPGNKENLMVYPNPTSENIHIKSVELVFAYQVLDELGQVLDTRELPNRSTEFDITLPAVGYYILKLYTETGIVFRKVLVE